MKVEVQGVSKTFADSGPIILENIKVVAQAGEFISLIGPSGCGKSTLLQIISGLVPSTSGCVLVDNQPMDKVRKRVSFIFQDATLLPWRTVYQNVGLIPELRHQKPAATPQQIFAMLDLVGLRDVAGHFPRQLSGGMKMRVSIARALLTSPSLLLMDEPFGALDEMTRDRMGEELLRLRAYQGWTAFFVTHSILEAVFLSDRVLVMGARPGRIYREVDVPFTYPRTDSLRTSPDFTALVREISSTLREFSALVSK